MMESNKEENNDDRNWKIFRNQKHSLSIPASSVAACVGFHEFQSIPELMLKHIYQGGQALLKHDSELLELEITSSVEEEEQLIKIAELSGSSLVLDAVKQSLEIKHGNIDERKKVATIEEAYQLKCKAAMIPLKDDDAKTKTEILAIRERLTKHQLQILQENTRKAIDTGCGNDWEDSALDQYERECGFDVRERNAECRIWNFEKVEGGIRPIAPAYARPPRIINKKRDRFDSRGVKRKKPKCTDMDVDSKLHDSAMLDLTDNTSSTTEESRDNRQSQLPIQEKSQLCDPPPFLTIKGMVDGVRDEFGPTTARKKNEGSNDDDDDQSFCLSRVVVECKHRMRSLLPYPRFSECIQAVAYCLMYDTDGCDIIQVIRTKTSKLSPSKKIKKHKPMEDSFQPSKSSFGVSTNEVVSYNVRNSTLSSATTNEKENLSDSYTKALSVDDKNSSTKINRERKVDEKGEKKGNTSNGLISRDKCSTMATNLAKESDISIKIAVTRISLDDHFEHRLNWRSVVLPKLRRYCDAVYSIRFDDNKRHKFLNAMAMAQSSIKSGPNTFQQSNDISSVDNAEQRQRKYLNIAWEIIFDECNFLRDGYSGERYRREIQM